MKAIKVRVKQWFYETEETPFPDSMIRKRGALGWEPFLITPVNRIDPVMRDANNRPERYFYYLIVFRRFQ